MKVIVFLSLFCAVTDDSCAENTSDRVVSMIFGAPALKLNGFSKVETITVNVADSESEDRYIFFRFAASIESLEKLAKQAPVEVRSLSGPLISLEESFRNDLTVFPEWFDEVKGVPDRSYSFCWRPYLEEAGKKLFFGMFEVRIDGYQDSEGILRFYGVCAADYRFSSCKAIRVDEARFLKASYLGLNAIRED